MPAQLASPEATADARKMIERVVAAGAHLSFEQIQACVDARADTSVRSRADLHMAWCPMCRREVADIAAQAPRLRAPLAAARRAEADEGRAGWWQTLTRWTPRAGPALSLMVGVAIVAGAVVLQQQGHDPSASQMRADAPATLVEGPELDLSALTKLGQVSPEAEALYRSGDFAALAKSLRASADHGQAIAAAALGLLYAQGQGVQQDPGHAEHYWLIAAQSGEASAIHNREATSASHASRALGAR